MKKLAMQKIPAKLKTSRATESVPNTVIAGVRLVRATSDLRAIARGFGYALDTREDRSS